MLVTDQGPWTLHEDEGSIGIAYAYTNPDSPMRYCYFCMTAQAADQGTRCLWCNRYAATIRPRRWGTFLQTNFTTEMQNAGAVNVTHSEGQSLTEDDEDCGAVA
jgi:hypothetical protein